MLVVSPTARQDEMQLRRQKLDYEEITPCLKEVSRTWDEMLNTPDRATIKFGYEKLLDCVKQGNTEIVNKPSYAKRNKCFVVFHGNCTAVFSLGSEIFSLLKFPWK